MKIVKEAGHVLAMKERVLAPMHNAPAELSELFAEVTKAWADEQFSEDAANTLHQEIDHRRKRQARAAVAKMSPGSWLGGIPLAEDIIVEAPKPASPYAAPEVRIHKRTEFSPIERAKRASRMRRRRYLARVASLPANLAALFTMPILRAVCEQRVGLVITQPNLRHFGPPGINPLVVIVEDRAPSDGPPAFDLISLCAVLCQVYGVAILAGDPSPNAYSVAASLLLEGASSLLIETSCDHA